MAFTDLFTGGSEGLDQSLKSTNQAGGFATGAGEKGLTSAMGFNDALMSGDPKAIMKMLGPQIGQAEQQGQQAKQTAAQFGNRSGGVNAGMQMLDDQTRAQIQDMISRLTGQAVATEGSMGQNLLNTGLSADQQAAQIAQMQHQNLMSSLLGQGIGQAMNFGETAGLGAIGGALPGGAGAAKGMQGALAGLF